MNRWKTMENLSPSTRQQPIPSTSSVAEQEKEETQERPSLVRTTSLPLPSEALEQGSTYKENSKTVSLETPTTEYSWLKEVEVAMPKCFVQRKMRKMFLEKLTASGDRRNLVRNTSLPLPSRAFKQGAIRKEKVSKISPSTRQQPIPSTSSVAKHEKQEKIRASKKDSRKAEKIVRYEPLENDGKSFTLYPSAADTFNIFSCRTRKRRNTGAP